AALDSQASSELVDGLGSNAKLLVMGASQEPVRTSPNQIPGQRLAMLGWASGTARDSEDTLQFSVLTGVRPMIERYPLEKAAEGYERMMSGKARFRVVLTMG